MEYLTGKIRQYKQCLFSVKEPLEEEVEVTRKDAYLDFAYKVFVWEDPTLTWTVLIVLHVLFWLIVQLELKLYGIIFLFFLVVFICDSYFEQKGVQLQTKRNDSSDAMRQVLTLAGEIALYLRAFRKESPSTFCGAMCMACLVVGLIARNISGYILTYLSLLSAFFGPLAFSKLPPGYTESIKKIFHTISSSEGIVAENELMPLVAAERDVDFNDDKTSVADSVTNSFASGISSMPSYLDADGSLDGLDEDLELQLRASQAAILNPVEYSSDSDSEHRKIQFKSSHFNGDTSSEEENYAKDLQFVGEVENPMSTAGSMLNNLTTIGSSLISNIIKTAVVTNTNVPKENDSDSEFEIISDDEVDKQT